MWIEFQKSKETTVASADRDQDCVWLSQPEGGWWEPSVVVEVGLPTLGVHSRTSPSFLQVLYPVGEAGRGLGTAQGAWGAGAVSRGPEQAPQP